LIYYGLIVPRLPLPAIYAGTALGGVALGVALFLTFGGGGDGGEDRGLTSDPRVANIVAFVPVAVERWSLRGPDGLYDVLSQRVKAVCSIEQFGDAMEGESAPAAFRSAKKIEFVDGVAAVRLVLITADGDVESTWRVEILPNGVVRLLEVPGSEECRAP
jgi:hypothetical protein